MQIDVLILSDLHLGVKTGSDDFNYSYFKELKNAEERLINWIEDLNPKRIVINGDGFELDQSKEKHIKKAYRRLLTFLYSRNTDFNKGNHDKSLSIDSKNVIVHTLDNGKSVCITHGHQNDSSMTNPFVKLGIWILGILENIFPGIDNVALDVGVVGGLEEKADAYAAELLEDFDYVVLGHTHNLKQEGNYFNSGTCQGGKLEGVSISGTELHLITRR